MKIHTTHSTIFDHQGSKYSIESKGFFSFGEFEEYLKKKNPDDVFIYSISNVDMNNNLIHPCNGLDSVDENINVINIHFKMINTKDK